MAQSLVQIYVHLVFSTKDRIPFFETPESQPAVHAYLAGTCNNLDSPAVVVGGVEDHAHLLCRMGKTVETSVLIRELKWESSKWIKREFKNLADFHWQQGYGAFSVSPSHVQDLRRYIENQPEHHKKESFKSEVRRLCVKYGVEIDERYVWE